MNKETKEHLEKTIVDCAQRAIYNQNTATEAMQFTQAALNVANVIMTLGSLDIAQESVANKD